MTVSAQTVQSASRHLLGAEILDFEALKAVISSNLCVLCVLSFFGRSAGFRDPKLPASQHQNGGNKSAVPWCGDLAKRVFPYVYPGLFPTAVFAVMNPRLAAATHADVPDQFPSLASATLVARYHLRESDPV